MRRTDARGRNALSVRLELQADCYAGVWGYFVQRRNKLEPGDLEEGLKAAAAGRRRLDPEALPRLRRAGVVHARQRRAENALAQDGLETGDVRRCNTVRVLTARQ
jgi:predicted metalloprotease